MTENQKQENVVDFRNQLTIEQVLDIDPYISLLNKLCRINIYQTYQTMKNIESSELKKFNSTELSLTLDPDNSSPYLLYRSLLIFILSYFYYIDNEYMIQFYKIHKKTILKKSLQNAYIVVTFNKKYPVEVSNGLLQLIVNYKKGRYQDIYKDLNSFKKEIENTNFDWKYFKTFVNIYKSIEGKFNQIKLT